MTVLDNIQLAMPVSSKVGAHQLLARVHLTGLENRKPETLSGWTETTGCTGKSVSDRASDFIIR
ncbi:MAG: hypothetical protein ABGX28_02595 [Methylococcales bacterium]